jgi:hypothetical protein
MMRWLAVEGQITSRTYQRIQFVDDGQKIRGDRIRLVEVHAKPDRQRRQVHGQSAQTAGQDRATANKENEQLFFIQDNGIGIDVQYCDRIFGLFNKLDSDHAGFRCRPHHRKTHHRSAWRKDLGRIHTGQRLHVLFHSAPIAVLQTCFFYMPISKRSIHVRTFYSYR